LAILPFPILYLLSDSMAFFLCNVLRYRRKTVMRNMANSFPELRDRDLRKLTRKYYRRLGQLMVETFKTISLSKKSLNRRCVIADNAIRLFAELQHQEQSAFIVMGHHGNWEWVASACSLACTQPFYILYKPLDNKRFNALLMGMRQRHGMRLIRLQNAFRSIKDAGHETNLTTFITDQSPAPESALWVDFLHQETAVFTGVEKMAIKLNRPIVYLSIRRIKRGYYYVNADMLVTEPAACLPGDITRLHTLRLEQDIIAQPETWLWSHKRWKHSRPVAVPGHI
jgi:KDO2-lipid IV(A) lauroyltransferase